MSKKAQKAAAAKQEAENALLQSLASYVAQENYSQVVSTADKYLISKPDDLAVSHSKLVALLHLNEYKSALELISKSQHASKFRFEQAYALYRNREDQEVLKVLSEIPASERSEGHAHLEAQVNYRLGHYAKSLEIYTTAFGPVKKMDEELATNVLAACIAAGQPQKAISVLQELGVSDAEMTYELAYNAACALIDLNDLAGSSKRLDQAHGKAKKLFSDEGASEAEQAEELAVIVAQQGYVAQALGQYAIAQQRYIQVLQSNTKDEAALLSASSNLLSLPSSSSPAAAAAAEEKGADEVARWKRRATRLLARGAQDELKLTTRQRLAARVNRVIVNLQHNKVGEARSLAESLQQEAADSETSALLLAGACLREKQVEQCTQLLQSFLTSHPGEGSCRVALTLAQLCMSRGDVPAALRLIESLPESLRQRPAVLATIVALCEKSGQLDAAFAHLSHAVQKLAAAAARDTLRQALEFTASLASRQRRHAQAADALERLVKEFGQDAERKRSYLAQLVVAATHVDPTRAAQFASQLPALPGSFDLAALEAAPAPNSLAARRAKKPTQKSTDKKDSSAVPASSVLTSAPVAGASSSKKRKRTPRYPKGFDPANPPAQGPDPERWLPKLKGRKRQKKGTIGKGSQGAASAGGVPPVGPVPMQDDAKRAGAVPAAKKAPNAGKKKAKKGKKSGW